MEKVALAEAFDIPERPRAAVTALFDVMRGVAVDQQRGASTYELVAASQTPDLDQDRLDEAARFLQHEVPGVRPPARCQYLSWADADVSWLYLPAADATGGEEVPHVDV